MSKTNAAGRKGPKVKVIILLIVLAIVIGFVAMMIYSASMMSGMTMAEVTELQKKNIENTISVSGIVESRTFERSAQTSSTMLKLSMLRWETR